MTLFFLTRVQSGSDRKPGLLWQPPSAQSSLLPGPDPTGVHCFPQRDCQSPEDGREGWEGRRGKCERAKPCVWASGRFVHHFAGNAHGGGEGVGRPCPGYHGKGLCWRGRVMHRLQLTRKRPGFSPRKRSGFSPLSVGNLQVT